MIDLHCHILPGIDDGPATMQDTLRLAHAAVAAGTTTIVATPHVSWDYPANDAARIAAKVEEVRAALAEEDIPLEVLPGAEIAMTRAAELLPTELEALRLGGGRGSHLLVECPLSPSAAGFDRVLELLRSQGHDILLAHPERCPAFQRDPAALEALVAQGMITQVTAGALVGRFGRVVEDYARRLVRGGLAHDIASDAHNVDRRPPSIRTELVSAGYGEQADYLGRAVPEAILAGTWLPAPPEFPKPKRGLGAMFRRA